MYLGYQWSSSSELLQDYITTHCTQIPGWHVFSTGKFMTRSTWEQEWAGEKLIDKMRHRVRERERWTDRWKVRVHVVVILTLRMQTTCNYSLIFDQMRIFLPMKLLEIRKTDLWRKLIVNNDQINGLTPFLDMDICRRILLTLADVKVLHCNKCHRTVLLFKIQLQKKCDTNE